MRNLFVGLFENISVFIFYFSITLDAYRKQKNEKKCLSGFIFNTMSLQIWHMFFVPITTSFIFWEWIKYRPTTISFRYFINIYLSQIKYQYIYIKNYLKNKDIVLIISSSCITNYCINKCLFAGILLFLVGPRW